jgi:hypothetical protein
MSITAGAANATAATAAAAARGTMAAAAASGAAAVVSDPLAELLGGGGRVKAFKVISLVRSERPTCTQLYLGNRGIERLHGFEPLTNLEVLWLNGNSLRAVTHLDTNIRLHELYLHVSSGVVYAASSACVDTAPIELLLSTPAVFAAHLIPFLSPHCLPKQTTPAAHATGQPALHPERQPHRAPFPHAPGPRQQRATRPAQAAVPPREAALPAPPEPAGQPVLRGAGLPAAGRVRTALSGGAGLAQRCALSGQPKLGCLCNI